MKRKKKEMIKKLYKKSWSLKVEKDSFFIVLMNGEMFYSNNFAEASHYVLFDMCV